MDVKSSDHEHHHRTGRACERCFARIGLILLVFLSLLASGCGTSNYAGKAENQEDDGLSNQIPVQERWESALDLGNPSVNYITTGADPNPQPVEVENPNEPRDPVSFALSLIRNGEGLVTGSGSMLIEPDRSFTGHSMIFSFKNLETRLTADTLTLSGDGVMKTTTVSGMATQAPCAVSFTIENLGNRFECDVVFAVLDLGIIRGYFTKEVLRTSVAQLSFVSNNWAKKTPGVTVHFPRKQYSDQTVLTGQPQESILSFQISDSVENPRVSGFLDIPSNLSVNTDRIRIDLNSVPAYIHEAQHTVRFHQGGTITTLDAEDNSVTSDYSLSVAVSAKNVTVYSPNPAYDPENPQDEAMDLATGKKTQYTVRMTLVLDGIETRTGITTEISRADVPDRIVGTDEVLIIPPMAGGIFSLEGGRTLSLTHGFSRGMTEDTVEAEPSAIQFDLDLSPENDGAIADGRLTLSAEITPANVPVLSVDFAGLAASVSGNAIHIDAPVRLERKHNLDYSTFVDADLDLTLTEQAGGDYLLELTVTSRDYETNISFSTKVLKTDGGPSLSDSRWILSPGSIHQTTVTAEDTPDVILEVPDSDVGMTLILGRRVVQGNLSTRASGSVRLVHPQFNNGSAFEVLFNDLDIQVDDDGRTLHIDGLWSFQAAAPGGDISANALSITFAETDAKDRIFQITLTVPGNDGAPSRTLEVSLPAEKTAGSTDLVAELLNI